MIRTAFLHGVTAASIAALAPNPTPHAGTSPRPERTREPDDDQIPGIPYDKPIGLTMRVLDGPQFDLQKYRGYVVWINIFATWCPPCNDEQPDVVALAKRYYDRGLRVIGMDAEETDNDVRAYRKKYDIPYPIAMDEDGGFIHALQRGKASGHIFYPAHLLFTPQGYLSYYQTGGVDPESVSSRLEALLSLVDPSQSPGPVPTRTPGPTATPLPTPSPRSIRTT